MEQMTIFLLGVLSLTVIELIAESISKKDIKEFRITFNFFDGFEFYASFHKKRR